MCVSLLCRVYVEKDGETVRKLYITSIEDQDSGSYICSGVVARQRLEKNVTMMLFSAYISSHFILSDSYHHHIVDLKRQNCLKVGTNKPIS